MRQLWGAPTRQQGVSEMQSSWGDRKIQRGCRVRNSYNRSFWGDIESNR